MPLWIVAGRILIPTLVALRNCGNPNCLKKSWDTAQHTTTNHWQTLVILDTPYHPKHLIIVYDDIHSVTALVIRPSWGNLQESHGNDFRNRRVCWRFCHHPTSGISGSLREILQGTYGILLPQIRCTSVPTSTYIYHSALCI